jgi:hypothetical protein
MRSLRSKRRAEEDLGTELSELQRDALAEAMNVAIGRASARLAGQIGAEVAMSAPVALALDAAGLARALDSQMQGADVCAVVRRYAGAIEGSAAVMFQGSSASLGKLSAALAPAGRVVEGQDVRALGAARLSLIFLESCIEEIETLGGAGLERGSVRFVPGSPSSLLAASLVEGERLEVVRIDLAIAKLGLAGHFLCVLGGSGIAAIREPIDAVFASDDDGGQLSHADSGSVAASGAASGEQVETGVGALAHRE